jgi:hypothetical protein
MALRDFLSSSNEGLGWPLLSRRLCEKIDKINRKRLSETLQHLNCRIFYRTLYTADVCPIHGGIDGKLLLRQAAPNTPSP